MNYVIFNAEQIKTLQDGKLSMFLSPVKLPKWAYGFFINSKDGVLKSVNPHDEHERAEYKGVQYNIMPYKVGQIIHVKESITSNSLGGAIYKAGGKVTLGRNLQENEFIHIDDIDKTDRGYIPSCQMKEKLSRFHLEIVGVKCVSVRDISTVIIDKCLAMRHLKFMADFIAKHGQQAWDDNAFVFINEFKRVEK